LVTRAVTSRGQGRASRGQLQEGQLATASTGAGHCAGLSDCEIGNEEDDDDQDDDDDDDADDDADAGVCNGDV